MNQKSPIEKIPLIRKILSRIQVKHYSVLGTRLNPSQKETIENKTSLKNVVIVDPAGLTFIQNGPDGASGASGAIYKKLGITEFPEEVKAKIHITGEAAYHAYPEGKVIHVVGPDFRVTHDITLLAESYVSVFREFITSGQTHLRLLPISGGIYSGNTDNPTVTPKVTWDHVIIALNILNLSELSDLNDKKITIEMCLHTLKEYSPYKMYFDSAILKYVKDEPTGEYNTYLQEQVDAYDTFHKNFIKAQAEALAKYKENMKPSEKPSAMPSEKPAQPSESIVIPFFEANKEQKSHLTNTFIRGKGYLIKSQKNKITLTPNETTIEMTDKQKDSEKTYFSGIEDLKKNYTIAHKYNEWTIEPKGIVGRGLNRAQNTTRKLGNVGSKAANTTAKAANSAATSSLKYAENLSKKVDEGFNKMPAAISGEFKSLREHKTRTRKKGQMNSFGKHIMGTPSGAPAARRAAAVPATPEAAGAAAAAAAAPGAPPVPPVPAPPGAIPQAFRARRNRLGLFGSTERAPVSDRVKARP